MRYQQLRTDLQRHVAAHVYPFLHLRLRFQAQKHPEAEQKQENQELKIVVSPRVLEWMGDSGMLTEWLRAGRVMGTEGNTGCWQPGRDPQAYRQLLHKHCPRSPSQRTHHRGGAPKDG